MSYRQILRQRYQIFWTDGRHRFSTLLSLLALGLATVVNFYAGSYATERASNPVTDVVLSNVPAFNVDLFFVYGSILLILFISWLCLTKPKRLPFTIHSLTLFILTRSVFVSLTHIGIFPSQIPLDLGRVTSKFIFGGDLFFSGHTGIPFLMALIFWPEKQLRYIFLAWSVFFGTIALLGHLHYSIDVLSAFFITHSLFHLSRRFFAKDYTALISQV